MSRGVTSDMTVQCCSSAKFGVAVFKASILDSVGGPSAKVGRAFR